MTHKDEVLKGLNDMQTLKIANIIGKGFEKSLIGGSTMDKVRSAFNHILDLDKSENNFELTSMLLYFKTSVLNIYEDITDERAHNVACTLRDIYISYKDTKTKED